jgi:hypothetical protein
MAKVTYPFVKFPIPASDPYPQGQVVYRPWTTATLTAQNCESLRCYVCLDTGADACLFPLALAIALELDVLSLPRTMTGGVGSTTNVTYYANVTIDIGNGISFPAYADFTEAMNAHGIGLLGQADFFSVYDVAFCQKQGSFTIDVP